MCVRYLMFVAAVFSVAVCHAEDVTCRFLAKRITKVSSGIKHDDRAFEDCRIYVFTLDAAGKYVERPTPLTTDKSGVASAPLDSTQVYFLYFAGRELTPNERLEIAANEGQMLLKFQAVTVQPSGSSFIVAKDGQALKATVTFSLPLWISYLQKLEAIYANSGHKTPKEILSKVRQLFYERDNRQLIDWKGWGALIKTDVPPIFSWNAKSGEITHNDGNVSLELCEALSNKYARSGLKFLLDSDNERKKDERFDHVSLRDGVSVIQIGHVLCGFESEYTPPASWVRASFGSLDSVAAATWAGDLGQAAVESERKSIAENRPPLVKEWEMAAASKASPYDIAGDIIGAGNAAPFRVAIEKNGASFSHEFAKLLYDPKLLLTSRLQFVNRYGFNLEKTSMDAASKNKMATYVSEFARFWTLKDFKSRPLSEGTKKRAVEYFEQQLRLFNTKFPALTPITPPLTDVDFDGLTQDEEDKLGTDPTNRDTDGDGLWDGWEANQVVPIVGTKLDHADPLHADIYVHVDYFQGVEPDEKKLASLKAAIEPVVKSFEKPRQGTFRDKGIRLHLEWEPKALTDINPLEVKSLFGSNDWEKLLLTCYPMPKRLTHRHALLALKLNSGVGRAAQQAFVVDASPLSAPATNADIAARVVAARFMRELGRTLGLTAGGLFKDGDRISTDETMFKPNHISIMNETWTEGLRREWPPNSGKFEWVLEYQDIDIDKELSDVSLHEPDGLGPLVPSPDSAGYFTLNRGRMKDDLRYLPIHGAIDWNQDGVINDGLIYENLSGVWWNVTFRPTLREWSRLKYKVGQIGSESYFFTRLEKLPPPREESPDAP